jgi:hypothetical protein
MQQRWTPIVYLNEKIEPKTENEEILSLRSRLKTLAKENTALKISLIKEKQNNKALLDYYEKSKNFVKFRTLTLIADAAYDFVIDCKSNSSTIDVSWIRLVGLLKNFRF